MHIDKRLIGEQFHRAAYAISALGLILVLAASPGCARLAYNFGTLEEGRIYRSAQPSPAFLRWLASGPEIRTLVNLRGDTPGWESRFAARHGWKLFVFDLSASRPPSQADVDRFLAILRDPSDQEPASDERAIARFVKAGEAVGFSVQVIERSV